MERFFYFDQAVKAELVKWPKLDGMEELTDFIRQEKIRYGVLDLATVVYNKEMFHEYFAFGPKTGMRLKKPLPEMFRRAPRDPRWPPFFEFLGFVY